MQTQRTLENCLIRILRHSPFYGHLLVGLPKVFAWQHRVSLHISASQISLCINIDYFSTLIPADQEALLIHQARHLIHLHPVRIRGRHRQTWDLACDLAINSDSTLSPCPEMYDLEHGLAAEEYYEQLLPPFSMGTLEGEGIGAESKGTSGRSTDQSEFLDGDASAAAQDDHHAWQGETVPEQLAETMTRSMVKQAIQKAHGELPPEADADIKKLLTSSEIPWQEILRQFIGTAGRVGRKSTWNRSHKRFGSTTPGIKKQSYLNILVAIDVSESTDQESTREGFARELLRIASARECRLTVLYANSAIQKVDTFSGSPMVQEVYRGGGFTDLRPPFDYARKMAKRPAAIIYLTDGEGQAPDRMEFPTLWVLTPGEEAPAPWGKSLYLQQ